MYHNGKVIIIISVYIVTGFQEPRSTFSMIFLTEGISGAYVIFPSTTGLRFFHRICVWTSSLRKFTRSRHRGPTRIDIQIINIKSIIKSYEYQYSQPRLPGKMSGIFHTSKHMEIKIMSQKKLNFISFYSHLPRWNILSSTSTCYCTKCMNM